MTHRILLTLPWHECTVEDDDEMEAILRGLPIRRLEGYRETQQFYTPDAPGVTRDVLEAFLSGYRMGRQKERDGHG